MRINTVSDFRKVVRMGPYAWPGGYAVMFFTSDGGCLCHQCADKERRNIADSVATKCDDGWRVVAVECAANYDTLEICDHCGTVLVEGPEEQD